MNQTRISITTVNLEPTTAIISCPNNYPNGTDVGVTVFLEHQPGSSASLCVRFYYYNSSAVETIDSLKQITIYSPSLGNLNNVSSMFSITASIPEIQIGGAQMENEGFEIAYGIRSVGPVPSGTYEVALWSGFYPQDVICGDGIYIYLQVGNVTNPIVGSSCHYVPAPQDNQGLVYSEVIGVTNST